ncbi:unnamed protein product, partial [Effrenium voratum]
SPMFLHAKLAVSTFSVFEERGAALSRWTCSLVHMEELKADLKLIREELPQGTCDVELVDSDLFQWEVSLAGPEGTPYKGGKFRFLLWFPLDFPHRTPRIKCLTPMYHCNIDQNGSVCLDLEHELLRLKLGDTEGPSSTRSSAYCIVQALLSLLAAPVPEDGLVYEASRLLLCDPQEYNRKAQEWTLRYA